MSDKPSTETAADPLGLCLPHPELDRLLAEAVAHKMTPAEIREQRVSWVFGMLPHDDARTREDVRRAVEEQGL